MFGILPTRQDGELPMETNPGRQSGMNRRGETYYSILWSRKCCIFGGLLFKFYIRRSPLRQNRTDKTRFQGRGRKVCVIEPTESIHVGRGITYLRELVTATGNQQSRHRSSSEQGVQRERQNWNGEGCHTREPTKKRQRLGGK